ncbi:MAG: hypothetical protein JWQ79_3845 [Mucilaginibacter sp.]|nr:hypothetical protein [Mucilaginibacter sp.]
MADHVDETNIHGTLANLPKSFGMKAYQGKVIKNTPTLMYLIKLSWNNQNYTTIYNFSKTKSENNYKNLRNKPYRL